MSPKDRERFNRLVAEALHALASGQQGQARQLSDEITALVQSTDGRTSK